MSSTSYVIDIKIIRVCLEFSSACTYTLCSSHSLQRNVACGIILLLSEGNSCSTQVNIDILICWSNNYVKFLINGFVLY